jgi:hypothetical protein
MEIGLEIAMNRYDPRASGRSGGRAPQKRTNAPRSKGMKQRFAIHRVIPVGILAIALVLPGSASFAQQSDSSSQPRAQQVSPSGRAQSGSSVQAAQSSSGNGANSSVNTVNSTIQVSGSYQGSTPDPNAPQGPLTLNIEDAIRRGLRFNLGAISANASVKQLRGERLAALSMLLPNIYGTLSENGAKIDLGTQGLVAGTFGPTLPLPTTVGPFHYYSALANVSESLSMTSLGQPASIAGLGGSGRDERPGCARTHRFGRRRNLPSGPGEQSQCPIGGSTGEAGPCDFHANGAPVPGWNESLHRPE